MVNVLTVAGPPGGASEKKPEGSNWYFLLTSDLNSSVRLVR